MKLSKLSISGYKSYGVMHYPIEFSDLNIIIGPNGVGKSNLVSFLEMIAYMTTDAFGDFVEGNGYAYALIHSRREHIDHIEGKLCFTDDGTTDEYEIVLKQGVGGELYISREIIRYHTAGYSEPFEKEFKGSGGRTSLLAQAEQDTTARIMLAILKGCRVFHFNDTTFRARIRMPGYAEDDRYLRSDGGNIAAYLYRIKNDGSLKPYYDRIVKMIREVFPRFDGFSLHPRANESGAEYITLNWKEKGCDGLFGPHQMSDGTIRFIALSTLLMGPVSEQPEIIILDEPEIGLHPHAIRVLSEMMRMVSKDKQIIVTTQSRDLLNQFDVDNIIVADFDAVQETSTLKRLDEEELKDWIDEYSLADLWEKNVLGGNP